jgi:hypothetical protein
MKTVSSLIASLVVAGTAQAAVVNYNFTLLTEDIYRCYSDETDGYLCRESGFAKMGAGEVRGWNQEGTGHFNYDTATPLNPDYQPPAPLRGTRVSYSGPAAMNDVSALFPESGASYQSDRARYAATIEVADQTSNGAGNNLDVFLIKFTRSFGDNAIETLSLGFADPTAQALTGSGIPSTLSGFGNGGSFYYDRQEASGDWYGMRGMITSLTPAVPEPETYAMLLAGLGMLGWRRKRRPPTRAEGGENCRPAQACLRRCRSRLLAKFCRSAWLKEAGPPVSTPPPRSSSRKARMVSICAMLSSV